ncbi:MAG: methylenetetrahydrofolate--tRNA-(uracil(54)-C(5))-methyltransferase (FADH(2)-oxidizing) TrmFO [Clostridia bacterium]|nr:methylenetetrahydrofolate--tRNA-(uracil(54)-C(5))-methyltransferase (FADH(2)-oxidizing) TrmFO [Clostridia bacterium]
MNQSVTVVGAGLAGCEAAWQCAQRGAKVTLYEMKPEKRSPAHSSKLFCELVCSNSLRAEGLQNAIGLLKEELLRMGSLIMEAAMATKVPAGGALAVDREAFASYVTEKIRSHPNITVVEREITSLDFDEPAVIAAGPLASEGLAQEIVKAFGEGLSFFDAAAPIVTAESIDMSRAYLASRYDKGTPDYINCPMTKEEYDAFYQALISAETAHLHGFENDKVFEGCMPVEVMASRGYETLLFGPLKPVGLMNPHTGKLPHAVVQLRKDNAASSLYNMVGFQTHLTWGEQKRVFGMIPGLEHAEFVRYGVMHRNTFLNSPKLLTPTYRVRERASLYFAGQITGVEGYIESASSGFVAGLNAVCGDTVCFPRETAIGALAHYVSDPNVTDFQPMNVNFGLLPSLEGRIKKKERKGLLSARALAVLADYCKEQNIPYAAEEPADDPERKV